MAKKRRVQQATRRNTRAANPKSTQAKSARPKSARPAPARPKRSRPEPGDVYEFDIQSGTGGVAYMQYIADDRSISGNGELVRIFPGTHARPLTDLDGELPTDEQFMIFFPVYLALHRRVVRHIGRLELPKRLQTMPVFKTYNKDYHTNVYTFFLHDPTTGTTTKLGHKLPRRYLDYPHYLQAGILAIEEKLLEGWTARTWIRPEDVID